ncbi:hypothetical protein LOAG_15684, partial [Loa loa]
DDFEDYSDDFEEETDTDNDKNKSSDEENNARKQKKVQFMHSSNSIQRKIDFTNATTINWEKMSEVERRYKMLKHLIGMGIVQFDLLDHHLIHANNFYAQMFGNTNYTQ